MNNTEAVRFLIQRKNKVLLPDRTYRDKHNEVYVATMLYGLVNLGYTFSHDLFDRLSKLSRTDIDETFKVILSVLNQRLGNDVVHKAMYSNFPSQVMHASDAELFINAMIHYWTNGSLVPLYQKVFREELDEKSFDELKVIHVGKIRDFFVMFTSILKSKTSISPEDVEYLEWYMSFFGDGYSYEVEKITMKETLAVYAGLVIKNVREEKWFEWITPHITNPNDVLRIATYLSGGDVSLSTNTKFLTFPRNVRRLLIQILNELGVDNIILSMSEMKPHFKKWVRLGEVLHPFEKRYLNYENTTKLFHFVRNDVGSVKTYNSLVEKYFNEKHYRLLVETLKIKPTMYARNLNRIINTMEHVSTKQIIMDFCTVIDKVSTPVLMNMISHFSSLMDMRYRVFFPKSNIGKVYGMKNNLPLIDKYTIQSTVYHIERELIGRFSNLDGLGKVYIDESLGNYIVPFSQRSASSSLSGMTRGSKFSTNGNTIRFFIYWENGRAGRVDLDLSVTFYNEDFKEVGSVWYRNLRNRYSFHSGDFVSAHDGASEFVDINVAEALQAGAVYAVPNLISYTGHGFSDLEKCYIGWMKRNSPMSGEIYEPSTVVDKIDVTPDAQTYIPVILDLKDHRAIVADISVVGKGYGNQIRNRNMIKWIGLSLSNSRKMTVKELLELHAVARGTQIVYDIREADTVFLEEFGLETDIIISEFL